MEDLAAAAWGALTAAGGTLALSFIIAIFLGIVALTLLFVGSAVVALEQFARASRSWRNRLGFGLLWSGVVGVAYLYRYQPELAVQPWTDWLRAWTIASAASIGAVAFAMCGVWLLIEKLRPFALTLGNALLLGIGYALVVGGSDNLGYALAPLATTGGVAA
ncbi:MAG TPA: hypothetical protein VEC18_11485, partial [Myxococcota bacterium]|nr:hypothetical protein [Myxococcota bacterium]